MNKKCTIGIVGFGKFGTLAAVILKKYGQVSVYHYKDNKKIREKTKKAGVKLVGLVTAMKSEVVILAVPISKTEEMIKNIAPLAKEGSLIVDIC